jgi:hypothetical protein
MLLNRNAQTLTPLILMLILTSGCADERATQIAREAADRQAQQNTTMAELHKEVSSGTRQLVEADAQARQEIVGVHRELQAERSRLDTGWSALEEERQQIADERRMESIFAPVATSIGGIVLLVVLLGFCWYSLVALRHSEDSDAQLKELLVAEILSDDPTLLGPGQSRQSLLEHALQDQSTK